LNYVEKEKSVMGLLVRRNVDVNPVARLRIKTSGAGAHEFYRDAK